MNEAQLRRALLKLPKADLHCHLDGSLRVRTVLELARRQGVRLPASDERSLRRYVQVAPTCRSLAEFLKTFDVILPLLRTPEALERVASELIEDCVAENIRYVEVRFAPMLNAAPGFPPDAVMEAVLKGLRRAGRVHGVGWGVIVCLFRSHSIVENRKAFNVMKRYFGRGVVGLDVAGDEARHPTMEFARFFEEADRLGIPATCHAGETEGTANLKAALELKVRRIGHGTHLMEDSRLLLEAARRKVAVEVGLTSNLLTKSVNDLREHPMLSFYYLGVPVTLNTDDRGILGIDLTHEYVTAHRLGLGLADLVAIARTGFASLFTTPARKRAWLAAFDRAARGILRSCREAKKEAPVLSPAH